MYALTLGNIEQDDNNRRILSYCDEAFNPESQYKVAALPVGQTEKESHVWHWLYLEDGSYQYKPIYEPDPEPYIEPISPERMEAQLTYTAMMTDTLLPEA